MALRALEGCWQSRHCLAESPRRARHPAPGPRSIVQGSDGLFDNMWDAQLLEAIAEEQVRAWGCEEGL